MGDEYLQSIPIQRGPATTGVDGILIKGSSPDRGKQLPGAGSGRAKAGRGGAPAGLENRPGSGPSKGRAMGDSFEERTARLLMDFLEYCAREPGTAARAPSSPEAAVLRHVAARIQETNLNFFSQYRGFRGNRAQLVASMAQELLASDRGGPPWGRVAVLVTFAGTLLERSPQGARRGKKMENDDVSKDCRLLVALLCAQLSGQHRAWLMANGGWDGFCLFFQRPLQPSWERQLVWVFLSYCTAIMLIYFWKKIQPTQTQPSLLAGKGKAYVRTRSLFRSASATSSWPKLL
ncbi:bcl-2-like protein 10 [Hippopotamus amphibius kiboko]|uniref:bcl-2-like protein 10 n=1 Tax=Hippopotamus amphibius kiboko TaxID=575201 RepID=UPI002591C990|nr:bcl-2-like protein 10 [Hippopotamus amphibius kiboko]